MTVIRPVVRSVVRPVVRPIIPGAVLDGPIITATLAPTGTLYDGENAADHLADLSTFTDTANYASSAGTIASVVFQLYGGEEENWSTIDTDTVLSAGQLLSFLVTDSEANTRRFSLPTVQAIAPAQFQPGDWSVADLGTGGTLRVTLSTVPDDGGSALTAIEYQVDGGSWVTSGLLDPGTFDITGLTDDAEVDIALRAVNAAGNGTASTAKAATPTSSTAATITSVSVGAYAAGAYPITIGATGQADGDDLYWVIVP
ncbi:MAG: fibronectin type III domain-containing protein, partial [Pseudooceanicola sp.]|nr:fibronectin type III domain-containing protein [Pseudooceanicola sp.]